MSGTRDNIEAPTRWAARNRRSLPYLIASLALLVLCSPSASAESNLPPCPEELPVTSWSECSGSFTAPDGSSYIGEFKDGQRHGQGTLSWPDGASYSGEFKFGLRDGQGTVTRPDGRKNVGQFANGRYIGPSSKLRAKISDHAPKNRVSAPSTIEVAAVQRNLSKLGFNVGNADGKLRPKTVQAIKSYQKSRGLLVTGTASPVTRRLLTADAEAVQTTSQINSYEPKLTRAEQDCRRRGYHPNSVPYGECVLEFERGGQLPTQEIANTTESEQTASGPVQQGGGALDDQTCQSYGYRPSQAGYNDCRFQLDQIRQQAEREQARYEAEMQMYRQQIAAYEARQEAIRKEKNWEQGMAMLQLAAGLSAPQSPTYGGAYSAPVQPRPPAFENYTVRLPSGNQVYCSYSTATRYMNCR